MKPEDKLADMYNRAHAAGVMSISKSWGWLAKATRATLAGSGRYSEDGMHERRESHSVGEDIDDFEYNLGVLTLSLEAKLPGRDERSVPVPADLWRDEVLHASAALLRSPYWEEPEFLRQALRAVRHHQLANILTRLPPLKPRRPAIGIALAIAHFVSVTALLVAGPVILASVLVDANAGDTAGAAIGLSAFSLVGIIYWYTRHRARLASSSGSIDEQTYRAWELLDAEGMGDWTVGGAGAKAYFTEMLRRGMTVPLLVFDLCAALMSSARNHGVSPPSHP